MWLVEELAFDERCVVKKAFADVFAKRVFADVQKPHDFFLSYPVVEDGTGNNEMRWQAVLRRGVLLIHDNRFMLVGY